MGRLTGKRALITGGTTGIGLETALRFIAEGARVAVTGVNPATLESARLQLGADALVLSSDAGKVEDQKALAGQIESAFGKLDILFLNAGIVQLQPLEQWTEEAFDRSISINLKGPLFLVQALLPVFAQPASVIVNGSVNAHIGMPGTTVYAATKAALISLTRTLSGELIHRGVRVNAISPGPVSTPLYGKLGLAEDQLKQVAASIQNQVPAGRFGTAREIADAVVFFASDESAFNVGSELLVDGGMSAI